MTNSQKTSTWKKTLIVGVVTLSTLAGTGFTAARAGGWKDGGRNGEYGQQMGRGGHGPMGGGFDRAFSGERLDRFLSMIDATPEQKEKITAIFTKVRDDMEAKRDARTDNRKDMQAEVTKLLKAPEFDRAAAENLLEGRDAMRDDSRQLIQTALLDAVEVLTPEQRTKVADFASERGGMFFGDRGHGWRN
ncbi:Spy/CpxP family protein refolding chaperone [Rhizobium sp. L1K21]|uniref:Spy/CpxP family protein refolding chaperone n=1 Tax=Rhizobium sp. L1K21 TaxID=2954933 RepID=UPI0020921897|nr:Spy/CpxP family protein refolding chaperone [Rhizobium sp. L1K21]MCO6186128.1 Spy/CpxP family protein refolding chaperone [Rhizobium sp. L1K21]